MEIGNKYVSNYQLQNNKNLNSDKLSEQAKVAEYFLEKYSMPPTPGIDITMGNNFIHTKGKVTLSISPDLVKKSMNDPKAAQRIKDVIGQMAGIEKYVKTHCLPDGTKAKSVNFTIDENGEVESYVEWEKPKDAKEDKNDKSTNKAKDKMKHKKANLNKLRQRIKHSKNPYDNSVYKNMVYRNEQVPVTNPLIDKISALFNL